MTSSLVGSEMCIRDRSVRALSSEMVQVETEAMDQAQEDCRTRYQAETVSYTHLTLPTICSV
eukprot:7699800-Prorocentrum_lima.AAC.1